MALLSETGIRNGLNRLGELAAAEGLELRLAPVGGSATALAYQARRSPPDVDAVYFTPPEAEDVRRLALRVAMDEDWPGDWLNDGAKGFLKGLKLGDLLLRAPGIEVHQIAPEQLLAMRLSAWRDDTDIEDARRLLQESQGNQDEVWAMLEPFLVEGDEAHHAYRIRPDESDEFEDDLFGEDEEAEEFFKEATVWMDGLDRIARQRGINVCIDFSATPYYLGRVGQAANRPFPWVVSDFGLIEAIESGLVKIPQLAVRDTTGAQIPGYFYIWQWILPQLTPAERGGKKASPKPEAILKYAHHPFAMLAGLWEQQLEEWRTQNEDPRPPVFIVVCKNTQIAKVIYEWLAEDGAPAGIPPAKIEGFRNTEDVKYTIRVDSKVSHEIDTGATKSDETRWMRFTLDTVGKLDWPKDRQGRPIYPDGFEELSEKLDRPLHPPGRDVRCIVSVGMLTEGWDCNTVTRIIGLRPFMSQLLCEQVVGRGLRRINYELGANGLLNEEVAKVFGVPFEIIPFKANQGASITPRVKRHHIHALPNRVSLEIQFPRIEGYSQAIRNRVSVDWSSIPPLKLEPGRIPPEVQVKGLHQSAEGGLSLIGPGRLALLCHFLDQHRPSQAQPICPRLGFTHEPLRNRLERRIRRLARTVP